MWNVKWLAAFLYIVNIQCSMIVGNYRTDNQYSVAFQYSSSLLVHGYNRIVILCGISDTHTIISFPVVNIGVCKLLMFASHCRISEFHSQLDLSAHICEICDGIFHDRIFFYERVELVIDKIMIEFICNFDILFTVPQTKSPHELSNSIWNEFSSPITETSDESFYEVTTHVHEPFFNEELLDINVTSQLADDVRLHCRVNDLREKIVS